MIAMLEHLASSTSQAYLPFVPASDGGRPQVVQQHVMTLGNVDVDVSGCHKTFIKTSASGVTRMMSTLENADSSVECQVSHIALHHREV